MPLASFQTRTVKPSPHADRCWRGRRRLPSKHAKLSTTPSMATHDIVAAFRVKDVAEVHFFNERQRDEQILQTSRMQSNQAVQIARIHSPSRAPSCSSTHSRSNRGGRRPHCRRWWRRRHRFRARSQHATASQPASPPACSGSTPGTARIPTASYSTVEPREDLLQSILLQHAFVASRWFSSEMPIKAPYVVPMFRRPVWSHFPGNCFERTIRHTATGMQAVPRRSIYSVYTRFLSDKFTDDATWNVDQVRKPFYKSRSTTNPEIAACFHVSWFGFVGLYYDNNLFYIWNLPLLLPWYRQTWYYTPSGEWFVTLCRYFLDRR